MRKVGMKVTVVGENGPARIVFVVKAASRVRTSDGCEWAPRADTAVAWGRAPVGVDRCWYIRPHTKSDDRLGLPTYNGEASRPDVSVSITVPASLLDRINVGRAEMEAALGVDVSTAAAIRRLLVLGCDADERGKAPF